MTIPGARLPLAKTARIAALDGLWPQPDAPTPALTPRRATSAEVAADPDRVLRDYVLAPYRPRCDPRGRLAAVNLLVESLALAGVEDAGTAVIAALTQQLGAGLVVWGVKFGAGRWSWEFYVYDPGQQRAEARLAAVAAALAPQLTVDVPPRLPPHHMWSLEVDAAALAGHRRAATALYVHGDSGPGASRSYTVVDGGLELGNLYTFFDPRRQPDAIRARIESCVHFGTPRLGLAAVVAPELLRCRRVCVANKRRADGLYFAGVDTDHTVRFLREHAWPAPLVDYLDHRRDAFAHLTWDLGLDFVDGGGAPRITRTAIYATA